MSECSSSLISRMSSGQSLKCRFLILTLGLSFSTSLTHRFVMFSVVMLFSMIKSSVSAIMTRLHS